MTDWYTEYTIVVELNECMSADFVDEVVEGIGMDYTIDGTTVIFTVEEERGDLKYLMFYVDEISELFDGMFKTIRGTLRGKDVYAEKQLTEHTARLGSPACRGVLYTVCSDENGNWLEKERIYEKVLPKRIKLNADKKRASVYNNDEYDKIIEQLDRDEQLGKELLSKRIDQSETLNEPSAEEELAEYSKTLEPLFDRSETPKVDDAPKVNTEPKVDDVNDAVNAAADSVTKYNKNTEILEKMVAQIEADANLGRDFMPGKRILKKKNAVLDDMVAQLDKDPMDFTPVKIEPEVECNAEEEVDDADAQATADAVFKRFFMPKVDDQEDKDVDDQGGEGGEGDDEAEGGEGDQEDEEPEADAENDRGVVKPKKKSSCCGCGRRYTVESDSEEETVDNEPVELTEADV